MGEWTEEEVRARISKCLDDFLTGEITRDEAITILSGSGSHRELDTINARIDALEKRLDDQSV